LSRTEQFALGHGRHAGHDVRFSETLGNQALELAAGPADIPAFHHPERGLHRDHVVAGDDVRLVLHPRDVHAVGVVRHVHHVGPAQLPLEQREEQHELVEIAQPLPPARADRHAQHPLRRRDDPQIAADARHLAFQHAPESEHAGLAVGDVVGDQKYFHLQLALLMASREFIDLPEEEGGAAGQVPRTVEAYHRMTAAPCRHMPCI
jgi:hypothetical protein